MFSIIKKGIFIGTLGISTLFFAQTVKVHSHNDYEQKAPFWYALGSGANSIEADVFLVNNQLYVSHEDKDIQKGKTFESLYLEPLNKALELNMIHQESLHILIDIKTDAKTTLAVIVKSIQKYPKIVTQNKVVFVISGNQPKPEEYSSYPEFIMFDYQKLDNLTPGQWKKVALLSLNFKQYSVWNGKGGLMEDDLPKVIEVIKKAKSFGKPFRFWAIPDGKTSWEFFAHNGVDFINTDHPKECVEYINNLKSRTFTNTVFSEVYQPKFSYLKKNVPVKNVILLIGDGNGLSQISSSVLANKGQLTLTQLKTIGLIKTTATDNFTTDSAAGATAFATGKKTKNRFIGVDSGGKLIPNITEILSKKGFSTGIITTDEIVGATPSAFYAHQKDRGMETEIAQDLTQSKLTFFAAGGKSKVSGLSNFEIANNAEEVGKSNADNLAFYLSENGVPHVLKGRGNLLAETVDNSLKFLKSKKKPFFMMVEGAQIDSGGHSNNVGTIVTEGIDFDRAITKAIQFADRNPGTLVVITADHETGGFSIPHGDMKTNTIEGDFTTDDHSATLIPVFSYGSGSENFAGVYENNEIFHKILKALKLN
ncbi:alkaline phosphatase [Chryseobacterium balustinum]|uniref:Alkaline phosphatase n=1 Tax=Chryseobacterium balustinum TaxID=246 RepID=A0AAX2IMD4_9FLAO|nr:alkaline phosphatase [Chryseobacterium balustinum]AZB29381.1 alkaline phosphatase [Chryseobacterium balustinum]SKC02298.1 alkaline phosphatase [Chryseobacterium balustinum]SQA90670.1 Alkaline phosphatase 3 precursor [Chryseobacterium balustinum]